MQMKQVFHTLDAGSSARSGEPHRILPAEDRGTILLATATAMDGKGG
jgi:hypothetical protein